MALTGTEIKAIREGKASIAEAYVRPRARELWLVGATIARYEAASHGNHDPTRDRKLLLHRREIQCAHGGGGAEGTHGRSDPPLPQARAGKAGDRAGAGQAAVRQAAGDRQTGGGTTDAAERAPLNRR